MGDTFCGPRFRQTHLTPPHAPRKQSRAAAGPDRAVCRLLGAATAARRRRTAALDNPVRSRDIARCGGPSLDGDRALHGSVRTAGGPDRAPRRSTVDDRRRAGTDRRVRPRSRARRPRRRRDLADGAGRDRHRDLRWCDAACRPKLMVQTPGPGDGLVHDGDQPWGRRLSGDRGAVGERSRQLARSADRVLAVHRSACICLGVPEPRLRGPRGCYRACRVCRGAAAQAGSS
jgi:hypothetical protein